MAGDTSGVVKCSANEDSHLHFETRSAEFSVCLYLEVSVTHPIQSRFACGLIFEVTVGTLILKISGFALLLFAPFSFVQSYGQRAVPAEVITITSTWSSWGYSSSDLAIRREGDHYIANGRVVPVRLVGEFLDAINEPPIPQPVPLNLGITERWLLDHAEEAGNHATVVRYQAGSARQKELFRNAFSDQSTIEQRLKRVYDTPHTDDYPKMIVRIEFEDKSTRLVSTDSQHPFMIPWRTGESGSKTYNAHISLALMNLLPEGFVNRGRLTAENQFETGLLYELALQTAWDVRDYWRSME